ncbi:YqhR family membrane protein [Rossellomorea aquimaris]|uniref:YqhR family membrane protein n=1 Tax=Rossellomorea aquimaris TaxID=189382 RepID=UPI0007D0438D|nr:YqhR family membrane protein [Rossellomorea aquimaris]
MAEQKGQHEKIQEGSEESKRDPKLEQNKGEAPLSFISMVILTGFIGGVFWSAISYLCYFFSFTKIEPNIIFEPWAVGNWKEKWIGIILSIVAYGIVSIGVALIYYGLLRKFKSMWVGAGYGIVLYLAVFFVLKPLFPSIKSFTSIDYHTLITSLCLYVLYGVFIGYSISYEENELRHDEQKEKSGEVVQ